MTHRTAAVLFVALAAVYLAAVNGSWAMRPDSALYLGLGRSLAEGRGMEFNGGQWWALPPVLPMLVAACRWVDPGYFLPNLIMHLAALAAVAVSVAAIRELAQDLPEAMQKHFVVAAALTIGFSAGLFVHVSLILTDVPFLLLISIATYAFLRGGRGHWGWYFLGAAALLVASWTRLPGVIFAAGLVLAVLLDLSREGYRRRALAAVGAGAIVLAGFAAWYFLVRTRGDPGTIDQVAAVTGERFNVFSPAKWPALMQAVANFPAALASAITDQKLEGWHFNLLPTAVLLVGLWTLLRRRQMLVLVPVALYVGFLIVLSPSSVAPRYFLPIMPMLVYGLLVGAQTLRLALESLTRRPAWPGWALAVVVAACVGTSAPKIAREIYWMRHPQFYAVYDGGKWSDFRNVSAVLRERGRPEADAVVASQPTIVHHLSGLRVAAGPPLWPREGPRAYKSLPPKEFAQAVARGPWRFVVMPADTPDWSEPMMKAIEESGALGPPERFGRLVLYERRTQP
jgi:hypothetical protein